MHLLHCLHTNVCETNALQIVKFLSFCTFTHYILNSGFLAEKCVSKGGRVRFADGSGEGWGVLLQKQSALEKGHCRSNKKGKLLAEKSDGNTVNIANKISDIR